MSRLWDTARQCGHVGSRRHETHHELKSLRQAGTATAVRIAATTQWYGCG